MGHFFFTPPVQSLEYRISFIEAEGREIYLCTSIYLKKKQQKNKEMLWSGGVKHSGRRKQLRAKQVESLKKFSQVDPKCFVGGCGSDEGRSRAVA